MNELNHIEGCVMNSTKRYKYTVNTFIRYNNHLESVQLEGEIIAKSEEDVIQQLIDSGTVYSRAYEFLDLSEIND
jgi:hypothetical protein